MSKSYFFFLKLFKLPMVETILGGNQIQISPIRGCDSHRKSIPRQNSSRIRRSRCILGLTIKRRTAGGNVGLRQVKLFFLCFFELTSVFQMMKGDFYVLEYTGWDNSYNEIVSSDRIRHKNTNPPLDRSMFHKFELEVPEDVREQ